MSLPPAEARPPLTVVDEVVDWDPAPARSGRRSTANGHAAATPARSAPQPPADPDVDRLSPQSIEAEQAVLGSVLIEGGALERVGDIVRPGDFYRAEHGQIFAAMLELQQAATPLDLVTLGELLDRRGQLADVGGKAYLTTLMNATPTAVHAEHYAKIVGARALARRAIIDAGRIAAIGYEEADEPEDLLARLRSVMDGIHASWRPTGTIAERLGARPLSAIATGAPAELLVGRLDPLGHTILYGTGGVGKGTLAASWILALVYAGERVLIVDYENHPEEWARRIHGLGGAEVLEQIRIVTPLTASWQGRRGALWDQAADLRALADDAAATVVVIDSTVVACSGTDPLKPEAAALYAGALEYIGRPALSLAHVDKAENLRYPFGSAFWHNLARMTWSLKRDGAAALLANRKANNYARAGTSLVDVTWDGGQPREVWERPHVEVLATRIATALGDGEPLSVSKICDALNVDLEEDDEPVKPDSVGRTLRRGQKSKPPQFEKVGVDRWTLA